MVDVAIEVAQAAGISLDDALWKLSGALFWTIAKDIGYEIKPEEENPSEILADMEASGMADTLQALRKENPPPPRPKE
jgi:hypothetical protein